MTGRPFWLPECDSLSDPWNSISIGQDRHAPIYTSTPTPSRVIMFSTKRCLHKQLQLEKKLKKSFSRMFWEGIWRLCNAASSSMQCHDAASKSYTRQVYLIIKTVVLTFRFYSLFILLPVSTSWSPKWLCITLPRITYLRQSCRVKR